MFPIRTVENCSKEYILIKNIGKGSFGNVFCLKSIVTKSKVAGKFIEISRKVNEEMIRKEIVIIASLHHDNIIEYISSYSSPKLYIIVTKYYSGETLYHRRLNETIAERDVALYIDQICKALMYMHEKCVIHRDIKATNVVFETKDGNHIRIIDFGLACKLDDEIIAKCGTRTYFAPEVIRSEQITGATDMWSLGVLTYWLLSITYPFPKSSEQASLIERGQYTYNAELFGVVSDTARNFMDSLLIVQPELRLTASSALQHRWLSLTRNNEPSSKSD